MSNSFFSNMSQWIIGIQPDSDDEDIEEIITSKQEIITIPAFKTDSITCIDSTNDEIISLNSQKIKSSIRANTFDEEEDDFKVLDDAAIVAINLAKNIGGSIFNIGKLASEQIYNSAVQLKNIVENTPIIGDFTLEYDKFVNDIEKTRTHSDQSIGVEFPWTGYNEEAVMKTLILGICKDEKNFLTHPPADVPFYFNYDLNYPIGMLMLREDHMLEPMRFKLVPKHLSEKIFWRNYFYKIHLIKQCVQLSTLEKTKQLQENCVGGVNTNDCKPNMDNEASILSSSNYACEMLVSGEISTDINKMNLPSNACKDQLADWEQELVNEMSNDPMILSDAVKIPEDLEKELLMELELHIQSTQIL